MQNFKPVSKWQEKDFWQKVADDFAYTTQDKYFIKIAVSHNVTKINAFFCVLCRNSRWWQENDFWNKVTDNCVYPVHQYFC